MCKNLLIYLELSQINSVWWGLKHGQLSTIWVELKSEFMKEKGIWYVQLVH